MCKFWGLRHKIIVYTVQECKIDERTNILFIQDLEEVADLEINSLDQHFRAKCHIGTKHANSFRVTHTFFKF